MYPRSMFAVPGLLLLAFCGTEDPVGSTGAAQTLACTGPPMCAPPQRARGCICVTTGWQDLTTAPVSPGLLRDVQDFDGETLWLAGWNGLALLSRDGGQTFGLIDARTEDDLDGVDTYDGRHVIFTSSATRRLHVSDDGGLTFWTSSRGPAGLGKCTYAPGASALCNDISGNGRVFRYDLRADTFSTVFQPSGNTYSYTSVRAGNRLALALAGGSGPVTQVLRSTDGGKTFNPAATLPDYYEDLWVSGDDHLALVVTPVGTTYRSTDGGLSFAKVLDQGGGHPLHTHCHLAGADDKHLFMVDTYALPGRYPPPPVAEIWTSADGGATWSAPNRTSLSSPLLGSFGSGSHGVLLGDYLAVTRDGGQTFTMAQARSLNVFPGSSFGFDPDFMPVLAVPAPHEVLFAYGWSSFGTTTSGVLRSRDDGRTFTSLLSADVGGTDPYTALAAPDSQHLFMIQAGPAPTLLRSTDGGATWTGTVLPFLQGMAFADAHRGVLAGVDGTGPAAYRTTDGGQTLTRVALPEGAALVAYAGHDVMLTNGTDILYSQDDGRSYHVSYSNSTGFLQAVALSPDGHEGWAGGLGPILLHTTDHGRTWAQVALPSQFVNPVQSIAISADSEVTPGGLPAGTRVAVLVGVDEILLTADSGATWKELWHPDDLGPFIYGNLVLAGDPAALYASSANDILRKAL